VLTVDQMLIRTGPLFRLFEEHERVVLKCAHLQEDNEALNIRIGRLTGPRSKESVLSELPEVPTTAGGSKSATKLQAAKHCPPVVRANVQEMLSQWKLKHLPAEAKAAGLRMLKALQVCCHAACILHAHHCITLREFTPAITGLSG
jgi:hypothetical protein